MLRIFNLIYLLYISLFTANHVVAQSQPKPIKPKAYGQVARLDDFVSAVEFSPDGKLLAIGTYEQTIVWNVEQKKISYKLPAKYGYVKALLFSPDNKSLYTGCYQTLEVFDLTSGKRQKVWKAHGSDITKIAWKNDGTEMISASKDRTVSLWKTGKSIPEKTLKFSFPIYDFSLTKNEDHMAIALGDDTRVTLPGQVDIVNLESGESIMMEKFPEQIRYASCVQHTADQKLLISGSNDTKAYVYEISTGKAIGFFGGHKRPINDQVLIPGSTVVITVSGGRTQGKNELKVWDYVKGDEFASFEPHTDIVTCVAISPDGTLLVTGGQDKTAIIWDIKSIYDPTSAPSSTKPKPTDPLPETSPVTPPPSLPE